MFNYNLRFTFPSFFLLFFNLSWSKACVLSFFLDRYRFFFSFFLVAFLVESGFSFSFFLVL